MYDEKITVKFLPNQVVGAEKFDMDKKSLNGQLIRFYMDIEGRTAQVGIKMPKKLVHNPAYITAVRCLIPEEEIGDYNEKIIDFLKDEAETEIYIVRESLTDLIEARLKFHDIT
ncbi:hypothetical protein GQ472_02515 [archaeon]|nr:hypothetical protein [archaeon]